MKFNFLRLIVLVGFVNCVHGMEGKQDENGAAKAAGAGRTIRSAMREGLAKKSADIDRQDEYGVTRLMKAARDGDFANVRRLLENKASVNFQNRGGSTALHYAVDALENKDAIIELLLEKSDLKTLSNNRGFTLLHSLAFHGYTRGVKLFLAQLKSKGLDQATILSVIDAQDGEKRTPLFLAADSGHSEVVKLLLDAGANKNLADESGVTPLKAVVNGLSVKSFPLDSKEFSELSYQNKIDFSDLNHKKEGLQECQKLLQ